MVAFFCTRCGTALEIEPEAAGGEVRCGQCWSVVRSPAIEVDIPLAQVVSVPQVIEALPYASPRDKLPRRVPADLELIAERLGRVEAPPQASDDTDAMRPCSYCGSTIARYLRKCPYCRNALWGM